MTRLPRDFLKKYRLLYGVIATLSSFVCVNDIIAEPPLSLSDSDGVPDLTPKPAYGRVPSNSVISATFDRALNAGTVDTTTFVVHSLSLIHI